MGCNTAGVAPRDLNGSEGNLAVYSYTGARAATSCCGEAVAGVDVRCLDGREATLAFKRTLYAFPPPCAPPEDAPPCTPPAPEAAARAHGTGRGGRGADN